MNRIFRFFCLVLLIFPGFQARASHIVGADFTYSCLGNNNYRFNLTMYRDCLNGTAGFDDPITLFIFNHNTGQLVDLRDVNLNSSPQEVEPENWNACVGSPYNICVEVASYLITLQLSPIPGGYDVTWARCCRNNVITNLSSPDCQGISVLAHVPGSDEASGCNSMPIFNQYMPVFLCTGMPLYFDHSATDTDGDSLVYEISNPYLGLNFSNLGASAGNQGGCPFPGLPPQVNGNNPMGPPPYQNLDFLAGHSYTNPFGSGIFSINSSTGLLIAQPTNPGLYVIAVSVKEYRNGILLSENKRDMQIHAIPCITQNPPPILTHDLSGLNYSGDTIFAEAGKDFCYEFTVNDTVLPSSILVTPVSTSFGGNGGFPPPYATLTLSGNTPPVDGTICWKPHCSYVGQDVPMIISARDTNDCSNYNVIFDTVWIHVLPSPNSPPVVTHDFSGLTASGDTILVNVQSPFCYTFYIIDTTGAGDIQFENILYDTIGVPANQVQVITTQQLGDTLAGTVCWNGYCNYGRVYHFVTRGLDANLCPPNNDNYDTVWIRVIPPPNPSPILTTDISGNVLNNDTIISRVHEETCFHFTVIDTSSIGWDSLGFDFEVEEIVTGQPTEWGTTYYATVSGDTLSGIICWTPTCPNVDQTYRVIVEGIQINDCYIQAVVTDTVYIHVIEPLKPPPFMDHDLGIFSTDNLNVFLEDNDTFCYNFILHDTLMPTYLTYSVSVEMVNGGVYNGPQPNLTYFTQIDSLVTGEICWEIPCEYADQNFRLVMEGVDTFDCHPGNHVFDTVLVSHHENPPAKVSLCAITVLQGDASIEIHWQQTNDPDLAYYIIYRKRSDETSFAVLDSTSNGNDTAWTDNTGINADGYVYCYRVVAVDRCGNRSQLFDEACTMLLTGITDEYTAKLSWTPYIGWPNGVAEYQVMHRDGVNNGPFQPGATVPSSELESRFDDVQYAITCFKVDAMENQPGCGLRSSSNEICLVFPSTLFLPNAFTPNGDGRNDRFIIPGEFVESFHITIFNRWGQLIYESSDQAEGWDGTYKGQTCPEGVYIFRVTGVGYDLQEHIANGTLSLVR